MPVKVNQSKQSSKQTQTEEQKGNKQALDPATLKQISKLAKPLAMKAAAMKQAGEELERSTFTLYADFREAVRENFQTGEDAKGNPIYNKAAGRQLAVNVLATVYDIPTTAIHLSGCDQALWVYPEKYTDKKGKEQKHPKAGKPVDMETATDDDKEIAVHPVVKGAAKLYQMASRLLKVAIPSDERAKQLVDEALDDDGTCQCTEPQLYQLATGASREIVAKGTHGGSRTPKVYDEKTVTAEVKRLIQKAWNGEELLPGYKGTLTLEEIGECVAAAVADLEAEHAKAAKAQAKAAKKGAKSEKADDEDEE